MARAKIPDRVEFTARVKRDLLAKVDAGVDARREATPSFNRTDALHEAWALWVAAEAAEAARKAGPQ